MSWVNWTCLGVVLLGVVLFLYGANYYNAAVGWAGVCLFVVGILVFLVHYVYGELTKRVSVQNS
jgi:membrane-bound ClpP family serine protease